MAVKNHNSLLDLLNRDQKLFVRNSRKIALGEITPFLQSC